MSRKFRTAVGAGVLSFSVLGTVLAPSAAQAASPQPTPVTAPASATSAAPSPGGQGLITVEQARQMHLSKDHATTITMPSGGRVVVTPFAVAAMPAAAPIRGVSHSAASPNWKLQKKWWGWWAVWFNKAETRRIGYGAATCAALVGRIPVVGWVLAASCGLLGIKARWAMDHGYCLYVTGVAATVPGVGHYRGAYCR